MAKTVLEIMNIIKENEVQMIDFKIVDINGQYRHVTIPAEQFSEETLSTFHHLKNTRISDQTTLFHFSAL